MTDSEKLDLLLADMQGMKADMQELKNDVQELKERVSTLETKVADLSFLLENEIRTNIQRVAEGHLDLSRNLHQALTLDNEKEMLFVRVNVLESEVKKVKDRIESIA